MRDVLVTGTDTEVGKTVVAAALLLAWRARGVRALGFKPAETGLSAEQPADSEVLAGASGEDPALARPLVRLREPLAPAVAGERAGTSLDPQAVLERIARLREAGYRLVVEGAGGLRAPLAWGFDALDLAARCDLAALVVAHAGLGTLNHCRLTIDALGSRGVAVLGVVLNGQTGAPGLAEATNPGALARLLPGVRILGLPRVAADGSLAAARRLAPLLDPLLAGATS